MATVRKGPRKRLQFAQISNQLLRDPDISSKARGIACMILSFPDDWETSVNTLARQLNRDGKAAVRTAFLELEERGYLVRYQTRYADGRLADAVLCVFDDPADAADYRTDLESEGIRTGSTNARREPMSENRTSVPTSTDDASPQVTPDVRFSDIGSADIRQSDTTNTDLTNTEGTNTEGNNTPRPADADLPPAADAAGTTQPTLDASIDDGPGCVRCGRSRADGHHHREEPDTGSQPSMPATDKAVKPRRAAWMTVADARPDIMELLEYLHDSVERCTGERPKLSKNAFDAMRRLVDIDGRTPDKVRGAIDWARNDTFWSATILGAVSLRKSYATMQAQALRNHRATQGPARPMDRRRAILTSEMERIQREKVTAQETAPVDGIEASPMDYLRQITSG